jgi:hypothetical protein
MAEVPIMVKTTRRERFMCSLRLISIDIFHQREAARQAKAGRITASCGAAGTPGHVRAALVIFWFWIEADLGDAVAHSATARLQ